MMAVVAKLAVFICCIVAVVAFLADLDVVTDVASVLECLSVGGLQRFPAVFSSGFQFPGRLQSVSMFQVGSN